MTVSNIDQVRAQAKALSETDRAELAHDLLASLDGERDRDAGAAWQQEILLRLAEVKQGTAHTLSRNELSDRLQRRFR